MSLLSSTFVTVHRTMRWGLALALVASVCTGPLAAEVDFDRDVGPVLTQNCLECHSGPDPEAGLNLMTRELMLAGGESGSAIVVGKPEASLIWKRVAADEMPPEHPLSERDKQLLQQWIMEGAVWGQQTLSRFGPSSDRRAGSDWWSLQPIVRPDLPERLEGNDRQNPIDLFIAQRRAVAGLAPSPEASQRVLLRRLTYDLLGVFPEPEELKAFLNDGSPWAYERQVERLLASPAFGERWARHWLDVARFGESHGFERDHIRLHSWRYRDWVVDAFNANLPYDEFARLQLAGDVLRPSDDAGLVATGFLVAGAYDAVGQSQQSAAMRAVVRQDEMEDYVSTVSQAFLGLTVHCARCHDHKFDPILQREYYQFAASLSGVRPGERPVTPLGETSQYDVQIERLARELARQADDVSARIRRTRRERGKVSPIPEPVLVLDSSQPTDSNAESDSSATSEPGEGRITTKTVHFQIPVDAFPAQPERVVSIVDDLGDPEESVWLGPDRELFLSFEKGKPKSFGKLPDTSASARSGSVSIVFNSRQAAWVFFDGQPIGQPKGWRSVVDYSPNQYRLQVHSATHARGTVRLFDRALSHQEVAHVCGVMSDHVSEADLVADLGSKRGAERTHRRFELSQLRLQRTRRQAARTYSVKPQKPGKVHLLKRGNPGTPGEEVVPAGIEAVATDSGSYSMANDASDAARREGLAHWITAPSNPLFARVIVNRLWYYHFGTGLVNTPSDFGFNGGRPSHPELLDWLAAELISRDWDLKAIHRLIVTSATYRQSSQFRGEAHAVDAENRLLWRMNPRRLEAEALRDVTLQAAGLLNREIGGPGFQDFETYVHNSQFYEMLDPVGALFNRRSLYRMWIRSGRSPFLDAFDCPDPSATAPQRAVTTTPLQSLTLMNHSFVLRMSEALAERMQLDGAGSSENEVRQLFHWCFGRAPSDLELRDAVELIQHHGRPALTRAILNSNEFLYVD